MLRLHRSIPHLADETNGNFSVRLVYVTPQLDGLDYAGIHAIYHHIQILFDGGEYKESVLNRIRLLYPHVRREEWDKEGPVR